MVTKNGQIKNKGLADIWKKYIISGLETRVYVKKSFSKLVQSV